MSTFLATTTVSVIRGSTSDTLGDEVPGVLVVPGMAALPVSLTERSRKIYNPESGELNTVRYVVGRAASGVDVQKNDRLLDNRTGKIYSVEEVTGGERTIGGLMPLMFDLRNL